MTPDPETCLVTGASRGIGAAVAARLARGGRAVYLNFREDVTAATALRDEIRASGGRAELLRADISEAAGAARMIQELRQTSSRLDALIHCASPPLDPKRVTKLGWEEDVLPQITVACRGFLNCVQAAKPLMARGGRIVVVLTDALFHTPPVQMGAYLAAKGALWGLARAAAKELQPQGIFVNAVSPSMTQTDLLRKYPERALEMAAQQHPMQRLACADEAAAVIEALVRDAGRYVNGANWIMNGGSEY
jgi:3-oxoacyl-[acyl-carrier protein] reductase